MAKIYRYFVEGECEEKLINALKVPPYSILLAGKVEVFNFINKRISDLRIATLPKGAVIILVYDVDVEQIDILNENIAKLKRFGFNDIRHVQSIKNFEQEIIYSTNLKNINDMFATNSVDDFKNKFIHHANILSKLDKHKFDPIKMWTRLNKSKPFKCYSNQPDLDFIKIKKSKK